MTCLMCKNAPARRKFCAECAARRIEESQRKAKLKYKRSPRGKIVSALWEERNANRVREMARARYKPLSGRIIQCQGIVGPAFQPTRCTSTWTRAAHNGRKKWCWACCAVFRGMVHAAARSRPQRSAA